MGERNWVSVVEQTRASHVSRPPPSFPLPEPPISLLSSACTEYMAFSTSLLRCQANKVKNEDEHEFAH